VKSIVGFFSIFSLFISSFCVSVSLFIVSFIIDFSAFFNIPAECEKPQDDLIRLKSSNADSFIGNSFDSLSPIPSCPFVLFPHVYISFSVVIIKCAVELDDISNIFFYFLMFLIHKI